MENTELSTSDRAARDPFFGRMLDTDGHFYVEPETYNTLFADNLGPTAGGFSMEYVRKFIHTDEHRQAKARNVSHFWEVKGLSALGAVDPTERVKALDRLGVKTQLVFPNTFGEEMRVDSPEARAGCIRYNDHAIAWSKATGWRAQALCQIKIGRASCRKECVSTCRSRW